MSQSQMISFRASAELKERLELEAHAGFRTVSQLLTMICSEWLQGRPAIAQKDGQPDVPAVAEVPPTYGRPRGRPRSTTGGEGQHGWAPLIRPFLEGRDRVTVDEVLDNAPRIPPAERTDGHRNAVRIVMLDLGWTEAVERRLGQPDQTAWFRHSPL